MGGTGHQHASFTRRLVLRRTMLWPKVATCELVAKRGAHLIQGEQSGQRSIEVVRHQERLHLPEQVG